ARDGLIVDLDAQRPQALYGGLHVRAKGEAAHVAVAGGDRAQDQGPVGDRLVAGDRDRALELGCGSDRGDHAMNDAGYAQGPATVTGRSVNRATSCNAPLGGT